MRKLFVSLKRRQIGQSVILLAFAMMALIAFVGLVTDIAILLVRYNALRRTVDAAAIAAASQMREGRDYMDLYNTAVQYIQLHGLDPDTVFVETCETNPGDPELCVYPRRKLVRVTAQIVAQNAFLRIFGFDSVRLQASSVAETAVIDVALVLDTSESMARETTVADYPGGVMPSTPNCAGKDPRYAGCCNDPNNDGDYTDLVCQPFRQVRDAAMAFIQQLDFVRGDRVALVTFDDDAVMIDPDGASGPLTHMIEDEALALATLQQQVGVRINPCGDYEGTPGGCAPSDYTYDEFAPLMNTNIGGGIQVGNDALTDPATIRRDAVWVMVLLTDGGANRTPPALGHPYGFCPEATITDHSPPWCRDDLASSRHVCPDPLTCLDYDADDYARDMADAAGLGPDETTPMLTAGGNFIAIYTIGMGDSVINGSPPSEPDHGEQLLRYIADVGDNGRIDNEYWQDWMASYGYGSGSDGVPDFCEGVATGQACGNYYYAPDANGLQAIFSEIASRMFTRLSR